VAYIALSTEKKPGHLENILKTVEEKPSLKNEPFG
jgi:hypothetical protein